MPPKVPNFTGVDIEDDLDFEQPEVVIVTTPSGTEIALLSDEEANFYNSIAERYQEHNKFKNISDLLELDRVLNLEVLCFRQSRWVLQESDYDGNPIGKDLQKNIKELSKEIRDIKSGLGIDKKTRDAGQGDTFADRWANILKRAKEFAYMRNEQVIKAIDLWKELQAKITLYKNCNDIERTEFECHIEDILVWLDQKFDEFDEIDEAFQKSQKYWIQDLNK